MVSPELPRYGVPGTSGTSPELLKFGRSVPGLTSPTRRGSYSGQGANVSGDRCLAIVALESRFVTAEN